MSQILSFLSSFKKDGSVSSSSIFYVGEFNEFEHEKHFLKSKKIQLEQPTKPTAAIQIIQKSNLNYETKLFTMPFLAYVLKWWNSDSKLYNLPFIKDGVVRLVSTLNPENDSLIAFLELNNQDVIINNSSLLSNSSLSEMPTKTDAYLSYMRKNKEQIAIQETYSRVQIGMGVVMSLLGMVAGAAAGSFLGPAGAAGGAQQEPL